MNLEKSHVSASLFAADYHDCGGVTAAAPIATLFGHRRIRAKIFCSQREDLIVDRGVPHDAAVIRKTAQRDVPTVKLVLRPNQRDVHSGLVGLRPCRQSVWPWSLAIITSAAPARKSRLLEYAELDRHHGPQR